jgi:hypothetical protein
MVFQNFSRDLQYSVFSPENRGVFFASNGNTPSETPEVTSVPENKEKEEGLKTRIERLKNLIKDLPQDKNEKFTQEIEAIQKERNDALALKNLTGKFNALQNASKNLDAVETQITAERQSMIQTFEKQYTQLTGKPVPQYEKGMFEKLISTESIATGAFSLWAGFNSVACFFTGDEAGALTSAMLSGVSVNAFRKNITETPFPNVNTPQGKAEMEVFFQNNKIPQRQQQEISQWFSSPLAGKYIGMLHNTGSEEFLLKNAKELGLEEKGVKEKTDSAKKVRKELSFLIENISGEEVSKFEFQATEVDNITNILACIKDTPQKAEFIQRVDKMEYTEKTQFVKQASDLLLLLQKDFKVSKHNESAFTAFSQYVRGKHDTAWYRNFIN